MYPNLRAEMARHRLKPKDLINVLDISEKSVRNKLSGKTPFTVPEAIRLKDKLFPQMAVEVLFQEDELSKIEGEIRYLEDIPKLDKKSEQYLLDLLKKREVLKGGRTHEAW